VVELYLPHPLSYSPIKEIENDYSSLLWTEKENMTRVAKAAGVEWLRKGCLM